MREYSGGLGSVRKRFGKDEDGKPAKYGKWQGRIRYRELDTGEVDESGQPVKGNWVTISKTFDVQCNRIDDRGRKTALKALAAWRDELVANEPARAKAEEIEMLKDEDDLTAASTVEDCISAYLVDLPQGKHVERSSLACYRQEQRYICSAIIKAKGNNARADDGGRRFGDIELHDLTEKNVKELRKYLIDRYSEATVQQTIKLLKRSLSFAVHEQAMDSNPAEAVTAPAPARHEINYLEDGERKRLLDDLDATLRGESSQCGGTKIEALGIKIALLTGMRQGEVCGLRWQDVDLNKQHPKINVVKAIGHDGSIYYEKNAKSDNAERTISVPPQLYGDLVERHDEMAAEAASIGERLSSRTYVLGSIDGDYLRPRNLYESWKRRADRLELVGHTGEPPTFHDLRHTFATVAAHSHIPEASLKEIMGHKSIQTTHQYYIGTDEKANEAAMELAMQRMYGNEN